MCVYVMGECVYDNYPPSLICDGGDGGDAGEHFAH